MTLPDKKEVYFSIEGLIHHFEQIMTNRGFTPPIGEAYGATETANGEQGFYIVSDGGNSAYRARCRPPSFINYQVFEKLVVTAGGREAAARIPRADLDHPGRDG